MNEKQIIEYIQHYYSWEYKLYSNIPNYFPYKNEEEEVDEEEGDEEE